MMIYAVIMAGGKGERFWPRSRKKLPKQLLSLTDDGRTMIQKTFDRITKIVKQENVYVVTNNDCSPMIKRQLSKVPEENILVEPVGKNTAPCIGLAAVHIAKKDPEGVMLILPSDHLIKNDTLFIDTLKSAVSMAKMGDNLVTMGITPSYPETGYGYINFGEKVNEIQGSSIYKVIKFVEKPDRIKAEMYLESGNYLWNSGMFVWKASAILKNMKCYMPDLYRGLIRISDSIDSETESEVLNDEYSKFESVSIDYGIMEHAKGIYTIPGNFGWDDVGSWTALERINLSDDEGNIIKGNIVSVDTKKCIIQGNDKLIATVGVENLVVVDTDDATLICSKDKCQEIKTLLKEMKQQNKDDYL